MAQLGSPGVQVNVIDESFYNPATPGTIPLVVLATAQDKTNASGTGIAPGTQAVNANSLYLATSQKDLTDRFGVPAFQKDASGNAIQGSELNEYGLFAAYSYLGASNSAYILRAGVDLDALVGQASAPVGNPASDSYWVDTASTRLGLFQWNADLQQYVNKSALILNSATDVVTTSVLDADAYKPAPSIGVNGDYAVVTYSVSANPNDSNTVWFKNADSNWVKVGSTGATTFSTNTFASTDWTSSWPAVTSKAFTTVSVTSVSYLGVASTNVTGTGTGATFNVTRSNGTYTVTIVPDAGYTTTGSGYVAGNQLKVLGSLLGGVDSTNDLLITLGNGLVGGTIGDANLATLNGAVISGTAVTTSSKGMKITIGRYDRTGNETVIEYSVDGGTTGNGGEIGATPTEIATQINALIPSDVGVGVRVRDSKLEFIANADYYIKLADPTNGNDTILAASNATDTVTAASAIGVRVGTYNAPAVEFSTHTRIPYWASGDTATINNVASQSTARPNGSLWVKTTEFNFGAKWTVKRFNGDTQLFETKDAPVYTSTEAAIAGLDPLNGGTQIALNSLFINANYEKNTDVNFRVMYRAAVGATAVSVTVPNTFDGTTAQDTITIAESVKNSATLNVVTFATNGQSAEQFVALIGNSQSHLTGTGLVNVTATYADGVITLTHKLGGEIYIGSSSSTLTDLGFSTTLSKVYAGPEGTAYDFRISNWRALSSQGYTVDAVQPTSTPTDGTLWYASYQNQVDVMIHNGTAWKGYKQIVTGADAAGPYVQASKPKKQRDGATDLVVGELWIDTSDQELYGKNIKRYAGGGVWTAVDTTDHTSQYGIIYADARWATTGESSTASTITALAASDFVDFDAPDPTAYPRGMLLWNTRRSGFNIKQYKVGYVNTADKNVRYSTGDLAMTTYYPDRWVSVSGQDLNQVAYFGRKAQRAYVVGQLKVAINTNQRILDEDNIFFNLIACPGYPELISDMVNLNSSRNGTALVVGDTPLRLQSNANALINYGTDYFNTGIDGEDGLHTNSDHLAVYYPAGLTTDLTGTNVVVPASHMMLRTIALSDQKAFQWFAPAGTRRGGVTNATSVGYLSNGSFIPVSLNQGTRDQMAQVKINPITNIPGAGLVAFGQYTKTGVNSSLDRINVARLVSYLRRQLSIVTKPFLFEPNDKQTRQEVKNVCESLMLDLVSLRGIYDFIVVCDETNNTSSVISNNQLYVDIAVEPVKAVEFIYIPLRLKNVGDIKSRQ